MYKEIQVSFKTFLEVTYPNDITINPTTNEFFVLTGADWSRNYLFKLNQYGEIIWSIQKTTAENKLGRIAGALAIEFHPINNNLFIRKSDSGVYQWTWTTAI